MSTPTRTAGGDAPRSTALQDRIQSLRLPSAETAPQSSNVVPWTLCLILLGTTSALGYVVVSNDLLGSKPAIIATQESASQDSASADGTGTLPAEGEILLESKGYIIPAHQILVSPKVSGMILRLHFDKLREGQRVPIGAPLAEIECIEYEADAARAQANCLAARQRYEELVNGSRPEEIEEAWNQWKEAEDQFEQFQKTYNRNIELRAKNVLSLQEFDQSKADYLAAQKRVLRLGATWKMIKDGPRKERIEAARADWNLAKAECAKAEWRLSNCTIRAPISGTILKKNAEEGNVVNPVAFNGSFSLCEMADLSDLEVDLSIQERDVSRVFVLQKCKIRSEAFPNRPYDGYVSRLMPIADRAKGAVPVRVKIRIPREEEGVYLKPEMAAVVTFLNAKFEGLVAEGDEAAIAETPDSAHELSNQAK